MSRVLLDTHVLIWWVEGSGELPKKISQIISNARKSDPLLVSEISIWEIAMLVQYKRIRLNLPLRDWLEMAFAPPLIERVGISPAVAAQAACLPDTFHKDPADRIIVASAKVLGARLLTCDQRIVRAKLVPC